MLLNSQFIYFVHRRLHMFAQYHVDFHTGKMEKGGLRLKFLFQSKYILVTILVIIKQTRSQKHDVESNLKKYGNGNVFIFVTVSFDDIVQVA